MHTNDRSARLGKVSLVVGLVGFAVAVVAAHDAPATGYEVSVYGATPLLFWGGIGVALAVSLFAGLFDGSSAAVRRVSMLLAGLSVFTVAGLPIVRGYNFTGPADPLTHLGWAREIAAGTLSPMDLLYPGIHTLAVFMATTFGVEMTRALQFVTLLFVLAFVVFVPLCVQVVTGSRTGLLVGLFVGLLLLPVTNVGTHVGNHPSSQAVMFLPFLLFLVFAYVSREFGDPRLGPVTASGVLLAIAGSAMILVHPEEGLTLIAVVGAFVGVQGLARRYRPENALADHRSLLSQFAVLAGVFVAWAANKETVRDTLVRVVGSILTLSAPGAEISGRASSVALAGGSIEMLFVKLFLGSAVFSLLAAWLGLSSLTGRLDDVFPEDNAFNKYLTAGMVPVLSGAGLVFLSAAGDHYFRYLGFGLAIVTVMGATVLTRFLDRDRGGSRAGLRAGITTLAVAVFLVFALATVHPSPFILQPNDQISSAEYGGYETAFDARQAEVQFTGVRAGQGRFVDAIYGPTSRTANTFPGRDDELSTELRPSTFDRYFDERRYVVITERDVRRELSLYDGFRYSRTTFETVREHPGVDRVESTGEFRLYYYDTSA